MTPTSAAAIPETAADSTLVPVDLGDRSYPIHIGPGLLPRAGALIAERLAPKRVVVITDENVGPLWGQPVMDSLAQAGIAASLLTLPAGEKTKSFRQLEELLDTLLDMKAERRTPLVALGGGVIGDLVGFAASVLLRGVPFVQIPTSLLAQVDSSVGGKTGINTRRGKNLVGAFHQPALVLADTGVLDTLPRRELLAGYAEVVKYGAIDDPAFFDRLESGQGAALLAGDARARVAAVATSCRAKARIVAADERESGQRALLNLGHTFGHALEAETGFGPALLHGEAVALGMVMALDLSVRLGLCPAADRDRLRAHLAGVGLRTALTEVAIPEGLENAARIWTAPRLMDHMTRDKKVSDGRITFVVAEGLGKARLRADIDPAPVRATLEAAIGGWAAEA